jgi:GAF domain-containing protein
MSTPWQVALQALQDSPTMPSEKLEGILKLGVESLDLKLGILSYIRGEIYTVKYFYPPDAGLYRDQTFEYRKTYCEITTRLGIPVAISPMYESEYHLHPCYEMFKLEAYIGISLYIRGRLYGTLNFSSPEERPSRFTNADRDLIRALGQAAETHLLASGEADLLFAADVTGGEM